MTKIGYFTHPILLAIGALMLCACGGCEAIPLVTLGSVLGIAGSAASAGSDVYKLGKLEFAQIATLEQSHEAVIDAGADLGLNIHGCKFLNGEKDKMLIEMDDDRKQKIEIYIDRRTGRLCQFRIDVGVFGFEPTAKLMMERIRAHLPASGLQTTTLIY